MVGAGDGRRLALDADRDRALVLLSVASRQPVGADVLVPIEAASHDWQRGDKALANLRLVFAGLPRLDGPHDAARLRLAEYCLDEGLSPRALMEELGLDPAPLGLGKYNRDEARVPEGNGIDSGRWTFGPGGAPVGDRGREDQAAPVKPIVVASNELFHRPGAPAKESADAEDPSGSVEDPHHPPLDILPITGPVAGGGGLPVAVPIPRAAVGSVQQLPPGVGPGPFASRSVPAGPSAKPTQEQQEQINRLGKETRCHTCETTDPGTTSGNFVGDHQLPTALNPPGTPQSYYPQCLQCSRCQGGLITQYKKAKGLL